MLSPEGQVIEALFNIVNKEGDLVPFILNSAQRAVDENLTGRDLVPKARQEGISSYVLARWLVKCLSQRNVRAVVISHDTESTQRMLAKVRGYIENMNGPKPLIKDDSKNHLSFPKTGSHFFIGTAGARKFGRGDTITHLHCSEVAFWPDPAALTAGLFQAVPTHGEIVMESTGNGVGNYYHNMCMNAFSGTSKRFNCIFLPWHTFAEYHVDGTREELKLKLGEIDADLGEDELQEALTPGQMLWRRWKLEEMNYDMKLFRQEYPMTLDECFQGTGSSVFYKVNHKVSKFWKRETRELWTLDEHPRKSFHYVVGADVGGGVGQDDSVVEVACVETGEQVAEYINNSVSPDVFAQKIQDLAERFNCAYVVVEANNHGIVTLNELRKKYPIELIYQMEETGGEVRSEDQELLNFGFRTSSRTKPLIIGMLAKALASELTIYSDILLNQCNTFIEFPNGSLGAEIGCKDDAVMAAGIMMRGFPRVARVLQQERKVMESRDMNPFKLDNILKELQSKGEGKGDFPIPLQV